MTPAGGSTTSARRDFDVRVIEQCRHCGQDIVQRYDEWIHRHGGQRVCVGITFAEPAVIENASIGAVYYQPPSDGVLECVSAEIIGGLKRFARFWPTAPERVEWGWTLHATATQIWPTEPDKAEPGPRCAFAQHAFEADNGRVDKGTVCRCGERYLDYRADVPSRWLMAVGRLTE